MKEEVRRETQEETLETATNYKLPWGSEEEQAIRDNTDDVEVAFDLGRTLYAVGKRRSLMGITLPRSNAQEQTNGNERLTLDEANKKRNEMLRQGIPYPTIVQRGNSYVVIEQTGPLCQGG